MPKKKQVAKPWENGGKAPASKAKGPRKKAISIPRRPSVIDDHGKSQFSKEINILTCSLIVLTSLIS